MKEGCGRQCWTEVVMLGKVRLGKVRLIGLIKTMLIRRRGSASKICFVKNYLTQITQNVYKIYFNKEKFGANLVISK